MSDYNDWFIVEWGRVAGESRRGSSMSPQSPSPPPVEPENLSRTYTVILSIRTLSDTSSRRMEGQGLIEGVMTTEKTARKKKKIFTDL